MPIILILNTEDEDPSDPTGLTSLAYESLMAGLISAGVEVDDGPTFIDEEAAEEIKAAYLS